MNTTRTQSKTVLCAILLVATAACAKSTPPVESPSDVETVTLSEQEVSYTAGDTTMKGFLAWNTAQQGKRPGILVVHEWWGHDDYVRERARKLAKLGYTALAVDMYGDGKVAGHPDDAKKFMMETLSNMQAAEDRFKAALELLKAHESTEETKMAAIGYCFGGGVVLHAARIGLDLDAVASFHGTLGTETPPKRKPLRLGCSSFTERTIHLCRRSNSMRSTKRWQTPARTLSL